MTSCPSAINNEKVISAWLDVWLPVLISLSSRRLLQVLWMRCIRSPGEVKHRLLPQSELPWKTGMTCREWDNCLWFLAESMSTHFCQCAAYIPAALAKGFFFFPLSVSKLIFLSAWKTALWHRKHYDLTRYWTICGHEKIHFAVTLLMPLRRSIDGR